MTITSTGNVGIGSTAPAAKLHVVGPAARPTDLTSVDTASTAQFQADDSNAHSLYIAENASGALIQVNDGATNSTTAKPLALQPFGGNVGIGTGTTAPARTFHVLSSNYAVARLERTGAGGGVSLEFRNGDGNLWQVSNDGDEAFRLYYAGSAERLSLIHI